jgi:hypothetical protein
MIPISSFGSYIIMDFVIGKRANIGSHLDHTGVNPKDVDSDAFKFRLLVYTATKMVITAFMAGLVTFLFNKPTTDYNTNGEPKSIIQQMRDCLGDIIVLLFVFFPLLSAGLIEASNNHLYSIVVEFGFSYQQALFTKLAVLAGSVFGASFYMNALLTKNHQLFYLIFCNCLL